jgi:hypothetical protein
MGLSLEQQHANQTDNNLEQYVSPNILITGASLSRAPALGYSPEADGETSPRACAHFLGRCRCVLCTPETTGPGEPPLQARADAVGEDKAGSERSPVSEAKSDGGRRCQFHFHRVPASPPLAAARRHSTCPRRNLPPRAGGLRRRDPRSVR